MSIDRWFQIASLLSYAGSALIIASGIIGALMASRTIQKLKINKSRPRLAKFVNGKAFAYHRWGSLAGAVLLMAHPLPLLFTTPRSGITLLSILVPFVAPKENIWMTLGVLALYTLMLVTVSSLLIKRYPRVLWRRLHYLVYLVYGLGLVHGLFISTRFREGWTVDFGDAEKKIVLLLIAGALILPLWRLGMLLWARRQPPSGGMPQRVTQPARPTKAVSLAPKELDRGTFWAE